MGVSIRLYDIDSPNNFKVEYTTSGYTNPYTYVGSYSGGTTIVVISGVNYNTLYYVKITDLLTGQYSIQQTLVTDPNCYSCFSGTSSYCYELDTTGGGTYNFTYDDVFGVTQTGSSINEIINICAQVDSVSYTGTGAIVVTNSFNPCDENSDCLPYFVVSGVSINQFVFSTLRSRIPFRVEWGDGAFTEYLANFNGTVPINGGWNYSTGHTYSSLYTGLIKVKANDLSKIDIVRTDDRIGMNTSGSVIFHTSELTKLTNLQQFYGIKTRLFGHTNQLPRTLTRLTSYLGQLSGETSTLPTGLTLLNLPYYEENIISGNTIDLPRTLTTTVVYGRNTITGSLSNMPTGSTTIEIWGLNTISGNTSDLSLFPNIRFINIYGLNSITGDIANVPLTVIVFRLGGYNSVYGDLQSWSGHSITSFGLENYYFSGNTVTGDIKYLPKSMVYILVFGENTIYGDLMGMPTGLTTSSMYFNIEGNNTIWGDISATSTVANNLTFFKVNGNNTISGNTNTLPNTLNAFVLGGNNTITGNVSDIAPNVNFLEIIGNNNVNQYSGKTWVNDMNRINVQPNTKFSPAAIDWLLQDVSGYTWSYSQRFVSNPLIHLYGTGTTASQLAIDKLTGLPPTGYSVNLILDP